MSANPPFNVSLERRITINKWIVKIRWFYAFGVLLIGILTKTISQSNVNFSASYMVILLIAFFLFNLILYFFLKNVKKNGSLKLLNAISYSQVVVELLFFIVIMHLAGGIESIAIIFFFLSIVSASLIFGAKGSIITALVSGLMINILVILEYYGIIPHLPRYNEPTLEFLNLPIALTKTITISIFYLIVGIFAGQGETMLFNREKSFEENAVQLDKQTKKLVKLNLKLSQMNRELLEEKNKFSSLILNFTSPIIVLDKNSKISLINPAAEKILGLSGKDLGKSVVIDQQFSITNFKDIIKGNYEVLKIEEESDPGGFSVENIILKNEQQDLYFKIITARVVGENNEFLGTMKIFYDLTREKMLDKLKSEFISIAAHQLRTPLSAIKWVVQMVLSGDAGKLNKEQKELLAKGYENNERVIDLVNDLLNVSRIEEGKFGYNFVRGNFQEVLNIVIGNIESLIAKNHIKLVINKKCDLPSAMYLDKERLVLAIQNILDNAVKYTPDYGKIEINIEKQEEFLRVSIKDNGVGIPKEGQEKIFSKFFRAVNVIRMQTKGTGLGLFIAKNIIEKHGGKIFIKSEEGKGTEVSFILPLRQYSAGIKLPPASNTEIAIPA